MLIRLASSCARSPTAVRSCPCCPLTIKHPFDSVSDRWLDELYALLLSAAESATKGQLDARVLALLHHTSPDLDHTAALEPIDDLLLGGYPINAPSPPSANLLASIMY